MLHQAMNSPAHSVSETRRTPRPGRSAAFGPVPFFGLAACLLLAACLFLAGCTQGDRQARFEKREATFVGKPDAAVGPVSSSQRFDAQPQNQHGGHAHGARPATEAFVFDLPDTWQRKERTSMRLLNFQIQERADAYCFLSAMEGERSMVLVNANRWRRQLGLGEWTDEDLASVDTGLLFGAPAMRVHWEGDFDDGMGGTPVTDAAMVGLIAHHQSSLVFLKMVGPKSVIDSEVENFDRFAASLDFPVAQQESHPKHELSYQAPEGWQVQAPRTGRDLGFDVGACDLSITMLVGNGGGLLPNVNRWRGQFGLPPLRANELDQLEPFEAMGHSGHWLSMEGAYTGMGSTVQEADGALEGAIVPLGDHTLFVKLVGPKDQVLAERDNLRGFTQSLRMEGHQ